MSFRFVRLWKGWFILHTHVCVCIYVFLSVQFSSVSQLCLTLCNPMNCSTPGLPVRHQLPELTQTHVHWVGDAIQPSHSLLQSFLPPSIFPSIRVFSSGSVLCIRWLKYWCFSINLPMKIEDWFPLGVTAAMKLKDAYFLEGKVWPT